MFPHRLPLIGFSNRSVGSARGQSEVKRMCNAIYLIVCCRITNKEQSVLVTLTGRGQRDKQRISKLWRLTMLQLIRKALAPSLPPLKTTSLQGSLLPTWLRGSSLRGTTSLPATGRRMSTCRCPPPRPTHQRFPSERFRPTQTPSSS